MQDADLQIAAEGDDLRSHELARRSMRKYSCKFSRRDFTLPQLFACLVVREHQNKSYRGIEALLRDSQHWCKQIGIKASPDHNTLWPGVSRDPQSERIGVSLTPLTHG